MEMSSCQLTLNWYDCPGEYVVPLEGTVLLECHDGNVVSDQFSFTDLLAVAQLALWLSSYHCMFHMNGMKWVIIIETWYNSLAAKPPGCYTKSR